MSTTLRQSPESLARKALRYTVIALVALALHACGGGGGGTSSTGGGGGSGAPGSGGGGTQTPPSASTPTITAQPVSRAVALSANAAFQVTATGNGTLTYAWRFNGQPIAGEISATLVILGVAASNAGSYDCVVTNTLNGTTATATSDPAVLTVVAGPGTPMLTGEAVVPPNSTGHVVTTQQEQAATYAWSIRNGTITAGDGTHQITYTAGRAGPVELFLTVSNIAGVQGAYRNVVVAASLPLDTLFAQSTVHPGSTGILASAPDITGQTYTWATQPLTATATIVGSSTSTALQYGVGSNTGQYRLALNVVDQAARTSSATRTVNVARNLFLKDPGLPSPRALHTATALNDGRVLLVAGDGGIPEYGALVPFPGSQSRLLGTTEVFDPVTRTFATLGSITPRLGHSATLLEDGRVLVVGGSTSQTGVTSSVEIFNPTTQTWSAAAPLATARTLHTATRLSDGRVLVIGGVAGNATLASAEVYDPVGNSWTAAGSMVTPRTLHSATRMQDGRVLVAAGRSGGGVGLLASVEIYNPVSNTWSPAASLPSTRNAVGAILLPSGKVLQLGQPSVLYDSALDRWDGSGTQVSGLPEEQGVSGEYAFFLRDGRVLAAGRFFGPNLFSGGIYDPLKRQWRLAYPGANSLSSVTPLRDGTFVEIGGAKLFGDVPAEHMASGTADVFDPALSVVTPLGPRAHAGSEAASAVLTDGRVLVSGGKQSRSFTSADAYKSTDVYDPVSRLWTAAAPMVTAREAHRMTALANGDALVTGGTNVHQGAFAGAERYVAQANEWRAAGAMSSPRYRHTATLLNDGRVIVAGGSNSNAPCNCTTFLSAVDLYDPATNQWTATGALLTARYAHTATRLDNGKILVAGGFGGIPDTLSASGSPLGTVELYDPATGVWSSVAAMNASRTEHTATLLPSGLVLVTGGTSGSGSLASAEVYDPVGNTWTSVASMSAARRGHAAVRLTNGLILVAGGFNNTSSALFGVTDAEIYDPGANTWLPAGPLAAPRQKFVIAPLPNAGALVVGGEPYFGPVPEFYQN